MIKDLDSNVLLVPQSFIIYFPRKNSAIQLSSLVSSVKARILVQRRLKPAAMMRVRLPLYGQK